MSFHLIRAQETQWFKDLTSNERTWKRVAETRRCFLLLSTKNRKKTENLGIYLHESKTFIVSLFDFLCFCLSMGVPFSSEREIERLQEDFIIKDWGRLHNQKTKPWIFLLAFQTNNACKMKTEQYQHNNIYKLCT